jgi:nucleotide-binding universal stress UspA family protein
MSLPRRILVPVDFGEPSGIALDYALELAAALEADVVALHVYEIPMLSVPDAPWVITGDVVESIENASKVALDRVVAHHRKAGVRMVPLLRSGDARSQIEAAAQEIGADLIVMGTHGRRGLTRALLGSVAEFITRTASVPVLTVRAPQGATHR